MDDSGYGGGMSMYNQPKNQGYQVGIGMNEAEYNKDAEQNRNIDMGELNELLGIWVSAWQKIFIK